MSKNKVILRGVSLRLQSTLLLWEEEKLFFLSLSHFNVSFEKCLLLLASNFYKKSNVIFKNNSIKILAILFLKKKLIKNAFLQLNGSFS